MKEQNAERLSEYEKAQIEFAKGKAEFLQGCGGCLMIPIIIIILLCIVILIGLIASPLWINQKFNSNLNNMAL